MKKILLIALICSLTACGTGNSTDGFTTGESVIVSTEAGESVVTSSESEEVTATEEANKTESSAPATNFELYALFMEQWKNGDVSSLFPYASDLIKSILDEEEFQFMFCGTISDLGTYKDVQNEKINTSGDVEIHSGTLIFENAKLDFELSISNCQIAGYYNNVRFVNPFDVTAENGVIRHYFLLPSGEYLLNAVFVEAAQKDAPIAIFIPGSGPCDYNETVGILPTFQDLATALADNGISSLRFEKRTLRYASKFKNESGLEEEYFQDVEAAFKWLKDYHASNEIWLLGHSLGVNVAAEFSNRHPVSGMILWNGSARHLAEIAANQYGEKSPANSESYQKLAEGAMAATEDSAEGLTYFGCSDYYWASYNKLDTISSIRKSGLPTLILNSHLDRQLFDEDLNLWQEAFSNDDKVTLIVFEDQSHFGYKVDTKTNAFYQLTDFPQELVDEIAGFMTR